MARFQVVVSKNSNTFDSIRDTPEEALLRIGQYMRTSNDLEFEGVGVGVCVAFSFGAKAEHVADVLRRHDYEVTIKELNKE